MQKLIDIMRALVAIMIYILCVGMFLMASYSALCMPSQLIAVIIIVFIFLINFSLIVCVMNDEDGFNKMLTIWK